MRNIALVGWDADRVMYDGLSTSICAEQSPLDPMPYIDDFVERRGWFTYDDVTKWAESVGRDTETPIKTVGDLANCLTAFLYSMNKPGSDESVITKSQTIKGKQAILRGLSIAQIVEISDGIEYTDGLGEAVETFRADGRIQTLFSDGLGPHVTHQIKKLGLDDGKGVPPVIGYGNGKTVYAPYTPADAVLTGDIVEMDKIAEFRGYLECHGIPLEEVAVIDDSGSNVAKLHVPVRDAGGVAVGFNVTDAHRPTFDQNSIPVIKGDSLIPFIEIVRNPTEATLAQYCD